ncbi:hypothetical protein [Microbacterium lacticum]|nr:hypothetical protein [Microbacterium lacticum]
MRATVRPAIHAMTPPTPFTEASMNGYGTVVPPPKRPPAEL